MDTVEAGGQDRCHNLGALFLGERRSNERIFNRFHDGTIEAVPGVFFPDVFATEGICPLFGFLHEIFHFFLHTARGAGKNTKRFHSFMGGKICQWVCVP
jgi:hypothetical protein